MRLLRKNKTEGNIMRKRKKPVILVIIVFAIALLGVVAWFISNKKGQKATEFRIGVVLPLTGDLANFGKTVLNGAQLSLDDFLLDNPKMAVRLIPEDSQAKPAVAVSAFQKLIDADGVNVVIGSLTSSATLAMAPIAQQRKVLLISPTSSNPKLSDAGPFFFRVWPSDSFDGRVAAEYCFSNLGFRKAGIIYLNNDYALGLKNVFANTFSQIGGGVTFTDSYLENTTDFRTLLTKASQEGLDVLYLPGHPRGIGTILKQARELDVNITFFSNVAAEDKEFITIAGDAADGLYFTAPAFNMETESSSTTKLFIQHYKERFSDTPDIHAVKGYEAMSVLLTAMKEGKYSSDEIKDFMHEKTSFEGISGNFSFDRNGDVVTPMSVKRYYPKGKIKILESITPTNNN
jgi:branched-chain amino acid transport system substrate-binding protein